MDPSQIGNLLRMFGMGGNNPSVPGNTRNPGVPIHGGQDDMFQAMLGAQTSAVPPIYQQIGFKTIMEAARIESSGETPVGELAHRFGISSSAADRLVQWFPQLDITGGGPTDMLGGVARSIQRANPFFGTSLQTSDPAEIREKLSDISGDIYGRFFTDDHRLRSTTEGGRKGLVGVQGGKDLGALLHYASGTGRLDVSDLRKNVDAETGEISDDRLLDKLPEAAEKVIHRFDKLLAAGRRVFGSNAPAGQVLRRMEQTVGTVHTDAEADFAMETLNNIQTTAGLTGGSVQAAVRQHGQMRQRLSEMGLSDPVSNRISSEALRSSMVAAKNSQTFERQFAENTGGIQFGSATAEDLHNVTVQNTLRLLGTDEYLDRSSEMAAENFTGVDAGDISHIMNKNGVNPVNALNAEQRAELFENAQSEIAFEASKERFDFLEPRFSNVETARAYNRERFNTNPERARELREAVMNDDREKLERALGVESLSDEELGDLKMMEIGAKMDSSRGVMDPANTGGLTERAAKRLSEEGGGFEVGDQHTEMQGFVRQMLANRDERAFETLEENESISLEKAKIRDPEKVLEFLEGGKAAKARKLIEKGKGDQVFDLIGEDQRQKFFEQRAEEQDKALTSRFVESKEGGGFEEEFFFVDSGKGGREDAEKAVEEAKDQVDNNTQASIEYLLQGLGDLLESLINKHTT